MAVERPRMYGKIPVDKGADGPQSSQPHSGKPVNNGPALARTVGGSGQRSSGNYKSTVARNPMQRHDPQPDQRMGGDKMATSTIGSGQRLSGRNKPTSDPSPTGKSWSPSGKGGS